MNLAAPSAGGAGARACAPLALALLAGCTTVGPQGGLPGGPPTGPYRTGPIQSHLQRDDEVGDCARHLQAIDTKVEQRGVRDAMAPRIDGFPYLRVDRFSASLVPQARGGSLAPRAHGGPRAQSGASQATDSAQATDAAPQSPGSAPDAAFAARNAWLARLSALDREARLVEFSNGELHSAEWSALERCRPQLLAADFGGTERGAAERQRFDALAGAAVVPDDYSESLRALGLYPLTRYLFASGIRRWHGRVRDVFAMPDNRLPTVGARIRYGPVAADDTSTLAGVPATSLAADADAAPRAQAIDSLGVPLLTRAQGWDLLQRHAPVLSVDTATIDDRLGRVGWRTEAGATLPAVDVALPAAYARIAFATLGGRVRVQLVYTFWFPARPAEHAVDALAGALDAVVWRVTLGEVSPPTAGRSEAERFVPLAYDTIHACGCYHLFFPTEHVATRPQPDTIDEGLFVPRSVRAPRAGERVVLHVAPRTHYLQQITIEAESAAVAGDATRQPALRYSLRDEDELRVLTLPRGGTRSIYDESGLVPGSERFERHFFWPMGITSAGQMRQWGRHATAFVGRRHFDDPLLLDRYFVIRDP